MSAMIYKGYAARIEFSEEDDCLVGHIAGIRDVVGFHGGSVSEVREAFGEAVEDYLEACRKMQKSPQKSYSGKMMLRVSPDVHASVAQAAQLSGKSINQWASDVLETAAAGNKK